MKRLFVGLVTLFLALGTIQSAEASSLKLGNPLLNLFEHSNYGGNYIAQYQATNCGTSGSTARQEFPIGWPARLQGSSFKVITTAPYCNVIGVHAYGGTWYQACTMSRRISYGNYGLSYFGNSQAEGWYNDNVDYVMVGYFSGCPLTN